VENLWFLPENIQKQDMLSQLIKQMKNLFGCKRDCAVLLEILNGNSNFVLQNGLDKGFQLLHIIASARAFAAADDVAEADLKLPPSGCVSYGFRKLGMILQEGRFIYAAQGSWTPFSSPNGE
jgi:hypothetical protein